MTKWKKEEGGYDWHVVSVITEWLTATAMMLYISTFNSEFKIVKLEEPPFILTTDTVEMSPSERY